MISDHSDYSYFYNSCLLWHPSKSRAKSQPVRFHESLWLALESTPSERGLALTAARKFALSHHRQPERCTWGRTKSAHGWQRTSLRMQGRLCPTTHTRIPVLWRSSELSKAARTKTKPGHFNGQWGSGIDDPQAAR